MKILIASLFALSLMGATVANAEEDIAGVAGGAIGSHHHGHRTCWWHHHHRICGWH